MRMFGQRQSEDGLSRGQLAAGWKGGIRDVVILLTGPSATGGAEEAAMMMYMYGWADTTWTNSLRQVRKWIRFCEEEGRDALPGTEGDVLA